MGKILVITNSCCIKLKYDFGDAPSKKGKRKNKEVLGHVPPYGGVLAAQHQLNKSNMYQPLIEVRIQRLRCLLEEV
jgi:hypothetical protein